jgi:hypothetical protein
MEFSILFGLIVLAAGAAGIWLYTSSTGGQNAAAAGANGIGNPLPDPVSLGQLPLPPVSTSLSLSTPVAPAGGSSTWTWKGAFDAIIWEVTGHYKGSSAILKALMDRESNFNPGAINPEKAPVSASELRNAILSSGDGGNDVLARYNANPSMGLLQLRWSTAKAIAPGIDPVVLFDPQSNIQIGYELLKQLTKSGLNLDTLDQWNVGGGSNWQAGVRNIPYRDYVYGKYNQYLADFPPDGVTV